MLQRLEYQLDDDPVNKASVVLTRKGRLIFIPTDG